MNGKALPKLGVYVASKMDEAQIILDTIENFSDDLFLTASWPKLYLEGQTPEPEFARHFWNKDCADIMRADWLVCYAPKKTSDLRGALIETGIAIGLRKKVILAGHKDTHAFGTWQYLPQLYRADTLTSAFESIVLGKKLEVI